jgi:heat shock protein HtpX
VELTKNPDAMISALRKIEGRGELTHATSAVMELCIDNPREEFANVFDTHPSVEARVAAIIKFAGGHDPGPLALETPRQEAPAETAAVAEGPWGEPPQQPSAGQGPWGPEPAAPQADEGPWGPHKT